MSAPVDLNDPPESPASPTPEPSPEPAQRFRPALLIFLGLPILAALAALLISGGAAPPGAATASPPAPPLVMVTASGVVGVGSPAPDFTLERPGGGQVRLADYRGGWVLLNFWATWCGPCRAEMPLLQDLVDGKIAGAKAAPGGVSVLAVNFDEPAGAVQAFLDEMGLSLTAALDPQGKISRQFGAYQLPITLFVDPGGVVRFKHIGGLTPDALDNYLGHMAEDTAG